MASFCMCLAAVMTSPAVRISSGFLRTPGFFRMVISDDTVFFSTCSGAMSICGDWGDSDQCHTTSVIRHITHITHNTMKTYIHHHIITHTAAVHVKYQTPG